MPCAPETNLQRLAAHIRQSRGLFIDNEWGICSNALMFGWVEQESSWDTYATREEPRFYTKYIEERHAGRREAWQLAISWGLLQVMGSTAREMGFNGRYLSQLCAEPALGLLYGAKYIRHQMERGDGTWSQGLAAYNGGLGGNRETGDLRRQVYVDEVVERARRYAEGG
jgi:soluble lytic murein transglycosylase-like protein